MEAASEIGADKDGLIFGEIQKSLFVRIASVCGFASNGVFLLLINHGKVLSPVFVTMLLVGMGLYLVAFLLSEILKQENPSVIVLLFCMDLMFFFGLVDERFQFLTLVLSPLIPSFTLLLLGYRNGSAWFYTFLIVALGFTLVSFFSSGVFHHIFPLFGPLSPFSFTLPILLGILNISGFSVLFQRYLETSATVIQKQVAEITRLSMTDPLTLIYNRRGFLKLLESEFARSKRIAWRIESQKKQDKRIGSVDENLGHLSVLLFDVDFFKKINDRYGHLTGDLVLTTVGDILHNRKLLRDTDCAARYGGEEFIIFEPDTNEAGALLTAERIRAHLENETFVSDTGEEFRVTCSCGISERRPRDESIEEVISRADKALYHAKEHGRNCSAIYTE